MSRNHGARGSAAAPPPRVVHPDDEGPSDDRAWSRRSRPPASGTAMRTWSGKPNDAQSRTTTARRARAFRRSPAWGTSTHGASEHPVSSRGPRGRRPCGLAPGRSPPSSRRVGGGEQLGQDRTGQRVEGPPRTGGAQGIGPGGVGGEGVAEAQAGTGERLGERSDRPPRPSPRPRSCGEGQERLVPHSCPFLGLRQQARRLAVGQPAGRLAVRAGRSGGKGEVGARRTSPIPGGAHERDCLRPAPRYTSRSAGRPDRRTGELARPRRGSGRVDEVERERRYGGQGGGWPRGRARGGVRRGADTRAVAAVGPGEGSEGWLIARRAVVTGARNRRSPGEPPRRPTAPRAAGDVADRSNARGRPRAGRRGVQSDAGLDTSPSGYPCRPAAGPARANAASPTPELVTAGGGRRDGGADHNRRRCGREGGPARPSPSRRHARTSSEGRGVGRSAERSSRSRPSSRACRRPDGRRARPRGSAVPGPAPHRIGRVLRTDSTTAGRCAASRSAGSRPTGTGALPGGGQVIGVEAGTARAAVVRPRPAWPSRRRPVTGGGPARRPAHTDGGERRNRPRRRRRGGAQRATPLPNSAPGGRPGTARPAGVEHQPAAAPSDRNGRRGRGARGVRWSPPSGPPPRPQAEVWRAAGPRPPRPCSRQPAPGQRDPARTRRAAATVRTPAEAPQRGRPARLPPPAHDGATTRRSEARGCAGGAGVGHAGHGQRHAGASRGPQAGDGRTSGASEARRRHGPTTNTRATTPKARCRGRMMASRRRGPNGGSRRRRCRPDSRGANPGERGVGPTAIRAAATGATARRPTTTRFERRPTSGRPVRPGRGPPSGGRRPRW